MDFEEGENFYATDDLTSMETVPELGVRLEVFFQREHLDSLVEMADSAAWQVKELEVTQESFSHGGYRGTLRGLLIHVRNGVEMMRRGYPEDVQAAFDRFRNRIDNLVGDGDEDGGECHLTIRDPSGLSRVHNADKVGSSGKRWVIVSDFKRTYAENQELDLLDNEYKAIDEEDKLSSPEDIAKLIESSKRVAVISGAGISVESGIPPFRERTNEDGGAFWKKFDPAKNSIQNLLKDEEAQRENWRGRHFLLPKMLAAKPNPAHLIFAKLEKMGKLHKIITQNIDSLHLQSGVPLEKILEVHGHCRSLICMDNKSPLVPIPLREGNCDFRMGWEEAKKVNYFAGVEIPRCEKCGAPLTTETVKFGQPLPEGMFAACEEAVSQADLVFVVGTSLVVAPANNLPGVALSAGAKLAIVNMEETQYDRYALGLVNGPAGKFFAEVDGFLEVDKAL
jgi:NAD-dependent deacetylase